MPKFKIYGEDFEPQAILYLAQTIFGARYTNDRELIKKFVEMDLEETARVAGKEVTKMLYDKETKEVYFDDTGCSIDDITMLGLNRYHKDKPLLARFRVLIPKADALELRNTYHVTNVKNIGDNYFFFTNVPKDCIKVRDSNGSEIKCKDAFATAHCILSGGGIWDTLLCVRFKLMQITDATKNISYPIISLKEFNIII